MAKVPNRTVDEGLAKRQHTGRAHRHQALVSRAKTRRSIVRAALRSVLWKNPRPAVAALESVSPGLLEDLAAELHARRERMVVLETRRDDEVIRAGTKPAALPEAIVLLARFAAASGMRQGAQPAGDGSGIRYRARRLRTTTRSP